MNPNEMAIDPKELGIADEDIEKNKKIKEEFLKPFTDEEISPRIDEFMNLSSLDLLTKRCLLERQIGDHKFMVYVSARDNNIYFDFQLLDSDNNKKAEITFERILPNVWDLFHRAVETGLVGITGSEFLEKSEEYMQMASERTSIKFDKIIAQVSQADVVKWLMKNNYDFSSEKNRQEFLDFQNHPEDYELIEVQDMHEIENYKKDLFIFKKSDLDKNQLRYYQKSELINPIGSLKPIKIRLSHQKLLKMRGLVRFHLKKEIN